MIIIETINSTIKLALAKGCDPRVIESQILKELNGSNLPFVVIADADGQSRIINKNNICSIIVIGGSNAK